VPQLAQHLIIIFIAIGVLMLLSAGVVIWLTRPDSKDIHRSRMPISKFHSQVNITRRRWRKLEKLILSVFLGRPLRRGEASACAFVGLCGLIFELGVLYLTYRAWKSVTTVGNIDMCALEVAGLISVSAISLDIWDILLALLELSKSLLV